MLSQGALIDWVYIGICQLIASSLHALIENLPLVSSAGKSGFTLALGYVAATIFVNLTVGRVAQSWRPRTNGEPLAGASYQQHPRDD
jgi:hypothetical protein